MKTIPLPLMALILAALACSSFGIDGRIFRPAEGTATASHLASTATADLAVTAAIERAVRLTLTAVASAPTNTPPPSPTAEPTTAIPPTDTPLPTATSKPASGAGPSAAINLALYQSTRASNSLQSASSMAVDGNVSTAWGAGDDAPQWIEIDLGAPATISRFRLLVTQHPYGDTQHRILVRSANGEFSEAVRLEQYTYTGQWLVFTPEQPLVDVQLVRIETLSSPSWVGWLEIQVLGER